MTTDFVILICCMGDDDEMPDGKCKILFKKGTERMRECWILNSQKISRKG